MLMRVKCGEKACDGSAEVDKFLSRRGKERGVTFVPSLTTTTGRLRTIECYGLNEFEMLV